MRFMFKHRKLTPNSQIRILLREEELVCLMHHFDSTHFLIDETQTEKGAIVLKSLIGNLLAAYRELDYDPSELMNIPDFTEPDEIPDSIEVFPPMSYIWDHKETQRMITAAGESMALGLSFGIYAIARAVETVEALRKGEEPIAETIGGWAYQLFGDAFTGALQMPQAQMNRLKDIASAMQDLFMETPDPDPDPLPPVGHIIDALEKEFLD
jgi:hypothetical protein